MARSPRRSMASTLILGLLATAVHAFLFPSPAPSSTLAERVGRDDFSRYFDVQAHRGGRGRVVESILPTFAFGLASGATTIELDIVLSEDDEVMYASSHPGPSHEANFAAWQGLA